MSYESEEEASAEAVRYQVGDDVIARLRIDVARKAAALGERGVLAHTVRFSPESWKGLIDELPVHIVQDHSISRGDVFEIAADVRAGNTTVTTLFLASFLWGTGTTGYGAARYRAITRDADGRLAASLRRGLDFATEAGPVAGYCQFFGGEGKSRADTGDQSWSRFQGFGPAFFTKLLYFCTPSALILDNVLARAVSHLCAMPHLVTSSGRSEIWTPYRYDVYLQWMHQTAHAVGTSPGLLELTLFSAPELDEDDPSLD